MCVPQASHMPPACSSLAIQPTHQLAGNGGSVWVACEHLDARLPSGRVVIFWYAKQRVRPSRGRMGASRSRRRRPVRTLTSSYAKAASNLHNRHDACDFPSHFSSGISQDWRGICRQPCRLAIPMASSCFAAVNYSGQRSYLRPSHGNGKIGARLLWKVLKQL